jgi:hypothetical protein
MLGCSGRTTLRREQCGVFTQTVAKQQLRKHISTEKLLSIRSASRMLLRNAEVNTSLRCYATHLCGNWSTRNNKKCVRSFLCSRRGVYITRHW